MTPVAVLALFVGCPAPEPGVPNVPDIGSGPTDPPTTPAPVAEPTWLTPIEHLARISIALRGRRPSPEEVAQVLADPTAIERLVDTFLVDPAFATTIEDMHAEFYRVRTDIEPQYPAMGILDGVDLAVIHESTNDEPLRLVADIVTRDLPYTEVVTADWIVADDVLSKIFGLPFDPEGPEHQYSWWSDGRPPTGVLSSSAYYYRYPSNGNNFHRGRAATAADMFLCDTIGLRDTELTVENAPPSTSVDQVVDTLSQPGCAGCHTTLEPMASFFWGYTPVIPPGPLHTYAEVDCDVEEHDDLENLPPGAGYAEDLCYPLRIYTPAYENLWQDFGLPAPALYGAAGVGMQDLGELIASDPRFPQCATKRFTGYLTQTDILALDPDLVSTLSSTFVDSNFNAKELVRAIVLSDAFRQRTSGDPSDPGVGLLVARPEQYASEVEALTGFVWYGEHRSGCEISQNCWGIVDLMRSDLYGYRALDGGIDGIQQVAPVHTPTPTRQLVLDRFATEAAAYVVTSDLALPPANRRLLVDVDPANTDEAVVRTHLSEMSLRVLTRVVDPDSEEVDALYALFSAALAKDGDAVGAWRLVTVALLTDPQMVMY